MAARNNFPLGSEYFSREWPKPFDIYVRAASFQGKYENAAALRVLRNSNAMYRDSPITVCRLEIRSSKLVSYFYRA